MDRSKVFTVNGVRVGVIGATVKTTPSSSAPGATAGLEFIDEAVGIARESERLRQRGIKVQIVVIHEGATLGANRIDGRPAAEWEGPIMQIVEALQNTTIDFVLAGHTHRIANTVVGRIPVAEGVNAGGSYSVAQLMVDDGDVEWVSPSTRVAKNIGVPARGDVQTIVDEANDETAELRNQVIGTQSIDLLRDLTRLNESAMGNLVADAMLSAVPGHRRCDHQLGRSPPGHPHVASIGQRGRRRDHMGRGVRRAPVRQPHRDRDPDRSATPTGAAQRLLAGVRLDIATGRFPQVSGLKFSFVCNGLTPTVTGMWKAPDGPDGDLTPIGPSDTVRFVTNDFMFGGGDGYTAFTQGTDVLQPGDALNDLVVGYIGDNSPVAPTVEGRIVRG